MYKQPTIHSAKMADLDENIYIDEQKANNYEVNLT